MTITAMYPIFATNSDLSKSEEMNKAVGAFGGLNILLKHEDEYTNYLIVSDFSGNKMDIVRFKTENVEPGFWGLHVETTDNEEYAKILLENGYTLVKKIDSAERVSSEVYSANGKQPNIALIKRK